MIPHFEVEVKFQDGLLAGPDQYMGHDFVVHDLKNNKYIHITNILMGSYKW